MLKKIGKARTEMYSLTAEETEQTILKLINLAIDQAIVESVKADSFMNIEELGKDKDFYNDMKKQAYLELLDMADKELTDKILIRGDENGR